MQVALEPPCLAFVLSINGWMQVALEPPCLAFVLSCPRYKHRSLLITFVGSLTCLRKLIIDGLWDRYDVMILLCVVHHLRRVGINIPFNLLLNRDLSNQVPCLHMSSRIAPAGSSTLVVLLFVGHRQLLIRFPILCGLEFIVFIFPALLVHQDLLSFSSLVTASFSFASQP